MGCASNHADKEAGVWIVMPVHNRRETTARCLGHLRMLGVFEWAQVLVVDDGSTDGTHLMLEQDFPCVRILHGDGGLWWSGAIRLGMQTAIQLGARCVVWLNDDTLPQSGALECLAGLAMESSAVCGGVARTPPESYVYAGGVMHKRWPQRLETVPGPESAPLALEWLHGNTVAIPAAVWRRIGLPEARWMKQTFSDIEYTLRAHRAGIPVLLVPAAQSVAQFNDSACYWSWADPRLSWWDILRGFGSLKVWWYLPGLACFKVTTSGLMGGCDCLWLCIKAVLAGLYKGTAIRRLTENIKKTNGLL